MPAVTSKIKLLFTTALEFEAADERNAYLQEACRDDPHLLDEIQSLLAAHQDAEGFLSRVVPSAAATAALAAPQNPIGSLIGPYKLREQIGEGGMGVVYVAEQTQPVRRKVALKIIKPGLGSREVTARFEAERQALAMMDHPHIARVFDGGATDAGQPYFVMELVQGLPITEYCDEHRLRTRERLELFHKVCRAVQHAHQRGVIHRDLKPSNVLVPEIDGAAVPKVIDFGVAKAVGQQLTDHTVYTQFSQLVGTPLYMSPEQAGLGVVDVDTRSDVYALGVLLYELLTGNTPFDSATLKRAGFDEMRRIIREDEPPKPSARVSTLKADALSTVSQRRSSDPRRLSQSLAGELDWLVMKALEKDRSRRYESASALAADVERYLQGQAVEACPPSAVYRFRKFSRRHRMAIATAAAVAAALLVGLAGTSWQAIRARRAEASVRDEAATSQAVIDFINEDLIAQANPQNEPDRDIRLRDVLDRTGETLGARFQDQPLVEAAIRHTLGEMYASLGEHKEAESHHSRARELRQQELGPENPATLTSAKQVADALLEQARFSEAEELYRATLAAQRRVLGDEHPDVLRTRYGLARLAQRLGQDVQAEEQYRQLLTLQRRILGEGHLDVLHTRRGLAAALRAQGHDEEAEALHREGLAVVTRLYGNEHPQALVTMLGLAAAIADQERYGEAEDLNRTLLKKMRQVMGEEHPWTLGVKQNLANSVYQQQRFAEAETLYREVFEARRRVRGASHPETLAVMNMLGLAVRRRGDYAEAEKLHCEVVNVCRSVLGDEHPETICGMVNLHVTWNQMVLLCLQEGDVAAAEKINKRALDLVQPIAAKNRANTNYHNSLMSHLRTRAALWWTMDRTIDARSVVADIAAAKQAWAEREGDAATTAGQVDEQYLAVADLLVQFAKQTPVAELRDKMVNGALALLADAPDDWPRDSLIYDLHPDDQTAQAALAARLQRLRRQVATDPKLHLIINLVGPQVAGPYRHLSDDRECLALMEQLIADAGRDNPAVWMNYGWTLYRHGRLEEAHQQLARAEGTWAFDRWPYVKYGLVLTHAKLGRQDEARRYFDFGVEQLRKSYVVGREELAVLSEAAAELGAETAVEELLRDRWPGPAGYGREARAAADKIVQD